MVKAQDLPTDGAAVKDRWIGRISRERKTHKKWRDQAIKAEEAYRDELRESGSESAKPNPFPIFWSTIQITTAAIFAKSPKPDVRKRYSDQGSSDDRIAQAVQRGLEFTIDTTGFGDHGRRIVDDYLVGGLGIAKVELDTEIGQGPVIDPTTQQPMIGPDGQPMMQKMIKRQSLKLRHFHWSKFGWEPGKDWEACDWVRFEHDMTAAEVKERFGVVVERGVTKPEGGLSPIKQNQYQDTMSVHEIWDRKKRQQLFITDSHGEPLEVNDDPLKLQDFYPCPKPIMLNVKADELVPKPDYQFVQKQCENIQRLTSRIHALTKQIKDVGFYDAQLTELAQLAAANDGTLIPIKNLRERLNTDGKADFNQVVATRDNTDKVLVLREMIAQRDVEKNALFEALGIADIVRGATVASETAAAQTIKSQWANVRIGPKVQAVSFFFRDVFRIMGEVIAEHFEPEQLNKMSGMQLTPEEIGVLKEDLGRNYAIDIEADSTMAQDDSEEKGLRLEMVKAMTDYMGVLLPLAQQNMMPAEIVKQTLLFVLRSFKYGRQLEETINQLPDSVAQLQKLNTDLQSSQQQLQQAQQQGQELQGKMGQIDQAENARKDAVAGVDNEYKAAQTEKVRADTGVVNAQAGAESAVQGSHEQAQEGMQMAVQMIAQTAQQLDAIIPALEQAAALVAQRPQKMVVIRDEAGRISGAEVIA